jgi:hypothetical protein
MELPAQVEYMPDHCVEGPGKCCPPQRWSTFIRNQAKGIVACDFCVVVTATFRILYVFVVIEHASRRLIHVNVTSHPTAEWTMQQFREAIPADQPYRILIHDDNAPEMTLTTPPKSTRETWLATMLRQANCHYHKNGSRRDA